jgi:PQQ-dependent catabolism-associated CXXCW motif protein
VRALFASAALAGAIALAAGPIAVAQQVAEPPGYRMGEYRAPTPSTLSGARVVGTGEAKALWETGDAVFIDVLPKPPKPDLPAGTVWRDKPRDHIAGSVWLPDVGYGSLSPEMETYFRDNLAAATGNDPSRTAVFYCMADCWMSWNAAKRALELGHKAVVWYPEGTDGWRAAGLPLATAEPVPMPDYVESETAIPRPRT